MTLHFGSPAGALGGQGVGQGVAQAVAQAVGQGVEQAPEADKANTPSKTSSKTRKKPTHADVPVASDTPKMPLPVEPVASAYSRPLAPEATMADDRLDDTIRPKTLDTYIGQTDIKALIQLSIAAAKERQEPMDHVLLYGPPGLGKTTLALTIANAMGSQAHLTSAPALERPRDIVGLLMALQPGDVLFVDEVHRLNRCTEEILYPAMEDGVLDRVIGKGAGAKSLRVPLAPFTLVAATTKPGDLSNPLRDRFGILQRLNYYSVPELVAIITRSAEILGLPITPAGAQALAERARGTPRIANRLLRRVRDYATVHQHSEVCQQVAVTAMNFYQIDPQGLDETDRRLLTLIAERFNGGPVGVEAMAAALGEDARTVEDLIEPYLLQMGFIHRTPRGRVLSPTFRLSMAE
jgi:holliday junction DNA helicase RuvB